jgi:hypothetical protein
MGERLDSSFQQQAFLPAREIGLNDRQKIATATTHSIFLI